MPSAKEILSTTAAEQLDAGAVDLVTVRNYDRFVGAMLVAGGSRRLMMEDLLAGPTTPVWAWTPWADGRIGETEFSADELTARAAVLDWLADAPRVRREPGDDISSLLPIADDWR